MHILKMPENVPFEHVELAYMISDHELNGKKCELSPSHDNKMWPDLVAVFFPNHTQNINKGIFRVHESWIEETKEESVFDKFLKTTPYHRINKKELEIAGFFWGASERNTHELYKPLVDYMNKAEDKYEESGGAYPKELREMLDKINGALK